MNRRLSGLLAVVFCTDIAAACLEVSDNDIQEITTEYGITTLEWTAQVHNRCDAPYDGTLTVQFRDADGDMLHEALDVVVVQHGDYTGVRRRINMPRKHFRDIDTVDVAVTERERPL